MSCLEKIFNNRAWDCSHVWNYTFTDIIDEISVNAKKKLYWWKKNFPLDAIFYYFQAQKRSTKA